MRNLIHFCRKKKKINAFFFQSGLLDTLNSIRINSEMANNLISLI